MRIQLLLGDCVVRIGRMADGSIGALVTDPPYGLRFMNKEFDNLGDGALQQAWHAQWLIPAFRVLEPGKQAKIFGGTRVFHRLAAAMVEVGFEGVHLDAWGYGSGFPKSLNVSKALDKHAGAKRGVKRIPYGGEGMLRAGGQNTRPWIEEALKKGYHELPDDTPVTQEAKDWDGWGTALKPSWEPVLVGSKPALRA